MVLIYRAMLTGFEVAAKKKKFQRLCGVCIWRGWVKPEPVGGAERGPRAGESGRGAGERPWSGGFSCLFGFFAHWPIFHLVFSSFFACIKSDDYRTVEPKPR